MPEELRPGGKSTQGDEISADAAPASKSNGTPATLLPQTEHGSTVPVDLRQIGGFKLIREIGSGGMGIVYECEDLSIGRRVAIKILRPELTDESFRNRFLREARTAGSLKSDHVVGIYQVGQDEHLPYLVMEYLEGETLEDRIRRENTLPLSEALRIARQVALGLAAAHANDLVHRDVKPANVWLDRGDNRVKLLDFGLAKPIAADTSLTKHGTINGTPGYMAPEQIYAGPLDGRTDLYALGCLLYRMLAGNLPFKDGDTMQLLHAVVSQDVPDLRQTTKQLPQPVAALLQQLLARNPDERPRSAAEVAERLRELERDSAVLARQLPTATKAPLQTRSGRPSLGVWIGAAVILLALVTGLGSLYYRFRPGVPFKNAGGIAIAPGEPIRVGVLHSLSGTFAESERPIVDSLNLAAEEINAAGGVLGHKLELIVADAHSDDQESARLAEKLITEDHVDVIFGCWSSSSRKLVEAVCAKHNHLLFYSCNYEGLEQSPYVVYTGGAPNQQLQPTARWFYSEKRKRRFFLVGSDYVYSRAANQVLIDEIKQLGATVVGEEYVRLTETTFQDAVKKIKETNADVILNTVDGNSNIALFQALVAGGIKPREVPTVWLSYGEEEMGALSLKDLVGDYAAGSYFQSIETPANELFYKNFCKRYPSRKRVSDPTEASYCALKLWKQAVEKAATAEPDKVRESIRGQSFDGPEGRIVIDEKNLHAWRMSRIAILNDKLNFEIVHASPRPIEPEPFPMSRSREEWEAYLKTLYDGWGGNWELKRRTGP